ncbi:hypothetical protein [Tateyamaria sp.]|uniref:hypothetical protein n=1 Tax=Tateyamaria sp. TaxID=1929288 RepID=UPI00329CD59F
MTNLKNMNRRKLILSTSSSLLLATPFITPSKTEANPLSLLLGVAGRAFVNTLTKTVIRTSVRGLVRNHVEGYKSTLRKQGFSNFKKEYAGEVLKEGFKAIYNNLQTQVISTTQTIRDTNQYWGLFGEDPDFLMARQDFMRSGNVRQMPGFPIHPYTSKPAFLNPIEIIGLNYAIEQRQLEGWNRDKIAACYFPVGIADHHYQNISGGPLRFSSDIQTPTGAVQVRLMDHNFERVISSTKSNRKFVVAMKANPYLEWCGSRSGCNNVFIGATDDYRGRILDL